MLQMRKAQNLLHKEGIKQSHRIGKQAQWIWSSRKISPDGKYNSIQCYFHVPGFSMAEGQL